jgi:hypothetical protein
LPHTPGAPVLLPPESAPVLADASPLESTPLVLPSVALSVASVVAVLVLALLVPVALDDPLWLVMLALPDIDASAPLLPLLSSVSPLPTASGEPHASTVNAITIDLRESMPAMRRS